MKKDQIMPTRSISICLAAATAILFLTMPAFAADPSADPAKAAMNLDQIQPAPQFPSGTPPATTATVPQAQRYLKNGQERFDEGLWADATTALERALKIDPNLVEARVLLARTAMQHGNLALAESHLKEALKSRPRDVAVHQLLGEIAFQQRKLPEAIAEFRLALKASEGEAKRPERVLTHLSLAMALKDEGYLTAAAAQFEAYLAAIGEPTPEMQKHKELQELTILYRAKAGMMLAELESELGRHDKAVEAYRAAAKENPDDRDARANLIRALARAGRHDEAITLAADELNKASDLAAALVLLEEACKLAKQPDRVNTELAAVARASKDAGVSLKLCELLGERGQHAEAAQVLTSLTKSDPENLKVVQLLVQLKIKLRQPAGLVDLLHQMLDKDIALYPVVEQLVADAYAANLDESISRDIAAAAKSSSDDANLLFLLACDRMAARDREGAVEAADAALKIDDEFIPAAAIVARMTLKERRWKDAIKAVNDATDGGLNFAELHTIKGIAHDALDEHEKAEASFLEAFRLDRKNPEPLFRLAQSIERRGEARRCEQLYRRILDDVDPRYVPARENLVRLLLNSRKTDRAKEYFSDFERLGQNGPAVERCRALLNFATSKLPGGEARLTKYREDLEKIIQDFPGEWATHMALAMVYEADGKMELALKEAETAQELKPDEIGVLERLTDYQSKLLDYESSAATLRLLLEYRPNNLSYIQRLVRCTLCAGDFNAAAEVLRRIIDLEEADEVQGLFVAQLVEVLRNSGKADESVKTARKWLDAAPEDGERRELYLLALNAADRKSEAVEAAREWLSADPASAELRRQLLGQLISAKQFVEAQQRIITWLSADPDDIELNRLLIRLFWEQGDWESAIDASVTGMEDPRQRNQYELMLGLGYRFAKRWDEAVELYRRRTAAAAPGLRTPDSGLIETLIDAERFEEAEKEISAALDQMSQPGVDSVDLPGMLRIRRSLARIYDLTDRMNQAYQQLEEIFAILEKLAKANPVSTDIKEQFIGINNDLGYTYIDGGVKLDQAEKMVRLALAEEPLNGAYIDSLGWVLYKRGKFEDAIKQLSLAVILANGDDAVMYDHLADAQYRAGHTDDARKNWEKALELSSEKVFPPPIVEDRRVHRNIKRKLKALDDAESVETAPLAVIPTASQPSKNDKGNSKSEVPTKKPPDTP